MSQYREVPPLNNREIAQEWDLIAPIRDSQISSGQDVTFNKVLTPEILEFLEGRRLKRVLDAGCGTGNLSVRLADLSINVDAVDLSAESIGIARARHSRENVRYIRRSIEFHAENSNRTYDAVVANMVLMDVANIRRVLSSIRRLMKPESVFIFSITHPWFWPKYYGYSQEPWFDYGREIFVRGPFQISASRNGAVGALPLMTTHVHRPMQSYVRALVSSGLEITNLDEPIPNEDIQSLYPNKWDGPRYLVGACFAN